MRVLLSIKPEYAYKIFEGSKKFEFRRAIFKDTRVKTVIVYASSPVQKVIGEFQIEGILYEEIEKLWQETQTEAGITHAYFKSYYTGKEKGYAIKIGKLKRYKVPQNLKEEYQISAPQSFAYLA
jgi:predicted transcriptional regulator